MSDRTISESAYYLSHILRDLKQAKKALDKLQGANCKDPSVLALKQSFDDCYGLASRMYCEETIK